MAQKLSLEKAFKMKNKANSDNMKTYSWASFVK